MRPNFVVSMRYLAADLHNTPHTEDTTLHMKVLEESEMEDASMKISKAVKNL